MSLWPRGPSIGFVVALALVMVGSFILLTACIKSWERAEPPGVRDAGAEEVRELRARLERVDDALRRETRARVALERRLLDLEARSLELEKKR